MTVRISKPGSMVYVKADGVEPHICEHVSGTDKNGKPFVTVSYVPDDSQVTVRVIDPEDMGQPEDAEFVKTQKLEARTAKLMADVTAKKFEDLSVYEKFVPNKTAEVMR
jgi:hypothetical protein